MNSIEDSGSSLRVTKHGKVSLVVKPLEDFLEHLQREGLDCFFASFGLAVSRTIDCNKVKLLNVGDPNQILMQQIGILI